MAGPPHWSFVRLLFALHLLQILLPAAVVSLSSNLGSYFKSFRWNFFKIAIVDLWTSKPMNLLDSLMTCLLNFGSGLGLKPEA